MDRDIALQLSTKLTAVKTALQTLVTSSTPASSRSVQNNRSVPNPEEQENPEEPEAIPEDDKK